MKTATLLILSFFLISLSAQVISVNLPEKEPVKLKPFAKFDYAEIDESSALVKSRVWKDVFWTLNDSGDEARIFPINRNGEVLRAVWQKEEAGITIPDAVNIDWEDISTDNNGNLIIGAFGNNNSSRRDLAIYILKDPKPQFTSITRIFRKIPFYFPEQKSFPDSSLNFDCEAVFSANDKIYLLTKHRTNTNTCLYRFDSLNPLIENPVSKIGEFNIDGMVTAADVSEDGTKLTVLTYNNIWLFQVTKYSDDYFHGKISWLPISAKQCEGICFDEDNLLISNEQTELFRISLSDLIPIR